MIDAIAWYEEEETELLAYELPPPLQKKIDLDALETLIGNNAGLSVSFTYAA